MASYPNDKKTWTDVVDGTDFVDDSHINDLYAEVIAVETDLIDNIKPNVAAKVDKVEGKGLSTNDYDDDAAAEVAKVANKVDKVEGKDLFSTTHAAALTGGEETSLHKHKAADVNITDTGEYFTGTEVETALQEVGADLSSHALKIADLEIAIKHIKIESWADVQKVVREGIAAKVFSIGDQFIADYNGTEYKWDIIGIDHDTPTDAEYTHSLTIQSHDCIANASYDAIEALYYAAAEVAAGEHIFTLNSLQYKVTTTQTIPIGGQVVVTAWQSADGAGQLVPTKITTYAADRTTAIEVDLAVTATTGVDTLTPVNHHLRVKYGSNNYVQSAIKQFINSDAAAFSWTPKTNFDRPPTGEPFNGGGFLKLLDPELVTVLGAVDKQVAKNIVTDVGGQDLFSDKVFLLSRKEIYGTGEGTITGESAYAYYSAMAGAATDTELAGRIKYLSGSARFWWLRSPSVTRAHGSSSVDTAGALSWHYAFTAYGLNPACCIV